MTDNLNDIILKRLYDKDEFGDDERYQVILQSLVSVKDVNKISLNISKEVIRICVDNKIPLTDQNIVKILSADFCLDIAYRVVIENEIVDIIYKKIFSEIQSLILDYRFDIFKFLLKNKIDFKELCMYILKAARIDLEHLSFEDIKSMVNALSLEFIVQSAYDYALYLQNAHEYAHEVEIESFSNKQISVIMGAEENLLTAKDVAYKYSKIPNCIGELGRVKNYWRDLLERLQVKTPYESINIILNGWAMYQTIVSRLLGRSGFYQSGGAEPHRPGLHRPLAPFPADQSHCSQPP